MINSFKTFNIDLNYAKPSTLALKLAKKYDFPPYLIERYVKMLGYSEAEMLLNTIGKGLRKAIRCNRLKISCKHLKQRLERKNIILKKIDFLDYGFWVIRGEDKIGHTLEYLYGFYYIQNPASMLPPLILAPTPEDVVLDMCAAPGGKTTHLAEIMENKGIIVATDISREKMKALRSHLSRMGVENVIAIRMDVREIRRLRNTFTKVLLDAPCSGEGLIPIDPESIRKRRVGDLYIMASKQVELLKIAYEVVRKGGEIVYSTCSIAPEENEFVLNEILNTLEDRILIEDPGINVGVPGFTEVFNIKLRSDLRKCIRLYPHKHGTEGFFICKLKKIG